MHRAAIVCALACAGGLPWAPGSRAAAPVLPLEPRSEVDAGLARALSQRARSHNERGPGHLRFTPYGDLHRVDENTYGVTVVRDLALPSKMTSALVGMRLERSASGDWTIGEQRVLYGYDGLQRSAPADERFYRFESVRIDCEGLSIRASGGSAVADYVGGRVRQLLFTSPDLAYSYAPPAGRGGQLASRHRYLMTEHRDDFDFDPEMVIVTCDPVSCGEILARSFRGMREVSARFVDARLTRVLEGWFAVQAAVRAGNPFAGFQPPWERDRRRYSIAVKQRGADRLIRLVHDDRAPQEFGFQATGYGELWSYPSAATVAAGADPHLSEMRDAPGAAGLRLVGLRGSVELATDGPERLRADLEFRLRLRHAARALPVRLEDAVSPNLGTRIRPRLEIETLKADGQSALWIGLGDSVGLVVLPEPRPVGSEVEIRMCYSVSGTFGRREPASGRLDGPSWIPFHARGVPIDDVELTWTTPARLRLIGAGTRPSERADEGRKVRHWVTRGPNVGLDLTLGDFLELPASAGAAGTDDREIRAAVWIDRREVTPDRVETARQLAQHALAALDFYRRSFDVDYPYDTMNLVIDSGDPGRGRAAPTVVHLSAADLDGNPQSAELGSVVAHEVAHQWWGSLVGHGNSSHYWLVESLAEYSAALFAESSGGGRPAYRARVERWLREVLASDLRASVQEAGFRWSNGGYAVAVYAKGPYVLHMLRETYGEERFGAFLRGMAHEFAGRPIVTRDLQRVAEAYLVRGGDGDLEWFFDQWIRGVGIPEFEMDYEVRPSDRGGFTVEGTISQRVLLGLGEHELKGVHYRGLVFLTCRGLDWRTYSMEIRVEGPATPFRVEVPVEPIEVKLNANREVLARPILEHLASRPIASR